MNIQTLKNVGKKAMVQTLLRAEGSEWKGTLSGLPAMLKRHPVGGHWVGYVQVPDYHKWYEKSIQVCTHWPQCVAESLPETFKPVGADGKNYWKCDHRLVVRLRAVVHGSVSFAGKVKGKEGWWLGFDCGRLGDLSPAVFTLPNILKKTQLPPYRTKRFALGELEKLAREIARQGSH